VIALPNSLSLIRVKPKKQTLAISEWSPSVLWTEQENCHDTKGSNRRADQDEIEMI